MQRWRRTLRGAACLPGPVSRTCLLEALWRLDIPVEYRRDGPFSALIDGNMLLAPCNKSLTFVWRDEVTVGQYVVWSRSHFVALRVSEGCCELLQKWTPSTVDDLWVAVPDGDACFYRIGPYQDIDNERRWGARFDRVGGASQETFEDLQAQLALFEDPVGCCFHRFRISRSVSSYTPSWVRPSLPAFGLHRFLLGLVACALPH